MNPVKHIVLAQVDPAAGASEVKEVFSSLAALKDQIAGILDFAGGPNVGTEGLDRGYTHGFVMTFADEASLKAYLPHPAHQAAAQKLLAIVKGGVEGVLVLDWKA
jgi:hypothetical protein